MLCLNIFKYFRAGFGSSPQPLCTTWLSSVRSKGYPFDLLPYVSSLEILFFKPTSVYLCFHYISLYFAVLKPRFPNHSPPSLKWRSWLRRWICRSSCSWTPSSSFWDWQWGKSLPNIPPRLPLLGIGREGVGGSRPFLNFWNFLNSILLDNHPRPPPPKHTHCVRFRTKFFFRLPPP